MGLFDMHGNAWEWCQDGRQDFYFGQGQKDREKYKENILSSTYGRALRGGAFCFEPVNARSADRNDDPPADRDHGSGFRPARTYH
jgi:formylglycine-generating enzyme required for sulfatase activity